MTKLFEKPVLRQFGGILAFERHCQSNPLAEGTGHAPVVIESDYAARTRQQASEETAGLYSFQTLYDKIVARELDVFESCPREITGFVTLTGK